MAGTLVVDFSTPKAIKKIKASYNIKNYDTIQIKTDGSDHAELGPDDFLNGITKVTASGNTLTVSVKVGKATKTIKFTNFSPDMTVQAYGARSITDEHVYYNDLIVDFYNHYNEDKKWLAKPSATSVTGSNFNEEIDLSGEGVYVPTAANLKKKVGVTVNAGAGNDTIIGTQYNDTFIGGAGENTIVYDRTKTETFGKDTVKLTKGENLTVDLSALGLTENQFKQALAVSGNNLLIKLSDTETINLASFAKGATADVDVLLKKAVGTNPAKIVHLNTDEIFSYDDAKFTVNAKKKTATLTTTRFADKITVQGNEGLTKTIKAGDGLNNISVESKGQVSITTGKDADTISVEDNNKNVSINAGNGENEISLTDAYATNTITGGKDKDTLELIRCGNTTAKLGDGENEVRIFNSVVNATSTIISGKGNDTINVDWTNGNTVIKAGKGVNTINIQDKTFGKVTIAEEKVKATNIINFEDEIDSKYTYTRNGNDLIIRNDEKNAKLTISGYYLARTSKTKYAEIKFQVNGEDKTLDQLLANATKTITGNGALVGDDGNDIIYNTSANNTITGGKGINTVVFDGAFGKDTINLTEGERLVLDISKYEYADECNISYALSGNDLVITMKETPHKAYGTLTIKGFAKSDITGGGTEGGVEAGVFLKLSDSETIDLRTKEYNVGTVKSSFTGGWLNEYINPAKVTKAITLTGGKGDDHINSANKATTFVFNAGDGNDGIYDTKKGDIIKINAVVEPEYERDNNDLIIRYGENDSIRVAGYYFGTDTKIDTIQIKQEDGSYSTEKISDKTGVEELVTKNVKQFDGKVVINANDPYNTINFTIAGSFSYGAGNDPENGETADDLIIHYDAYNGNWGDYVVLKGYISGESKVKYMVAWDGHIDVLYPIPYHVGTNGADEFGTTDLDQEYYFLKGGNDTIKFDAEFGQENDIVSVGTKSTVVDTLEFKDYSFEDGDLTFDRWYGDNALTINNNTDRYSSNRVSYENYFSYDSPEINVVDKNGSIDLKFVNTATAVDWSGDEQNHVLWVDTNGADTATKTIISNGKRNYIESGRKIDYTYNGGKDSISASDGNDKYTVSSFTENTNLMIQDAGGNDMLVINANSSDMYMLFNVNKMTYSGDVSVYESNRAFVHKDAFNVQTLKDYLTSAPYGTTVNGLVKLTSEIETIQTNDSDSLDFSKWETYIGRRVGAWIEENGLVGDGSLQKILSDPEKYGITDAKLADLLECYRVSFADVPVNKEMTGTTGNDTFVLGKANNTITINNATIGHDTIESTADFRIEDYKDKIVFGNTTGYSFADGTLSVGVNDNNLVIGKSDDLANNSITYTNFATDTCRNDFAIQDASGTEYNVHAKAGYISFANNTNNIAFVDVGGYSSSYPSVTSSNGTNYIYTTGEHHNTYDDRVTGIVYGYRDGTDTVVTSSASSSDTYSISQFTATSKLSVVDNGGDDDYMILGTQSTSYMDRARLVFNVSAEGEIDYSEFKFVHKDALTSTTLKNSMTSDLVDGVLEFKMATTGGKFGIEEVAYDYQWAVYGGNNDYKYADMNAWADEIASNVQNWLNSADNTGSYTSAYEAFEDAANIDAQALGRLITAYNVGYTQE